jgi:hypothetical protein
MKYHERFVRSIVLSMVNIRNIRSLLLPLALLLVTTIQLSADSFPAPIGSFQLAWSGNFGNEVTVNAFSDTGAFLFQTTPSIGSYNGPTRDQAATDTVYIDQTTFTNAVNKLVPGTTITSENFNSPSFGMTVTDQFVIAPACTNKFGCTATPPNPYPTTTDASGSSISGVVGGCSGPPRCDTNGWPILTKSTFISVSPSTGCMRRLEIPQPRSALPSSYQRCLRPVLGAMTFQRRRVGFYRAASKISPLTFTTASQADVAWAAQHP